MRVLPFQSPHFSNALISVDFLVVHATHCSLEETLAIFQNPSSKVTSHFVIDREGICYEGAPFLQGGAFLKAAHAGLSSLDCDGKLWTQFNHFSIGVEMVNWNGNLFHFTASQYFSLAELVLKLQSRFPILKKPSRIVGHEHLSFWRGKVDPGLCFNWSHLFSLLGSQPLSLHQFYACQPSDLKELEKKVPPEKSWPQKGVYLENQVKNRYRAFQARLRPQR